MRPLSRPVAESRSRFLLLQLPHAARPRQAAAEGDEHDVIAPLDLAGAPHLVETEARRSRGAVAEPVDVDVNLVVRHAEPLLGGFDDPNVGLVDHELGDLVDRQTGRVERLLKWSRRNPGGAAALGTAIAAVVGTLILSVVQHRLDVAERREEAERFVGQARQRIETCFSASSSALALIGA